MDVKSGDKTSRMIPIVRPISSHTRLTGSFFWSDFEALSILNKIESSFFSFGKSLLKLNKKSLSCVKNLPLSAILLETDAPFQTLKNEVYTKEDAIFEVYKSAYKIKKDYSFDNKSFFEFSEVLANNFNILLSN